MLFYLAHTPAGSADIIIIIVNKILESMTKTSFGSGCNINKVWSLIIKSKYDAGLVKQKIPRK